MLPTEVSGSVPVALDRSLVTEELVDVYASARRDIYHSLKTLSELAETRRLHFGRTSKAFTKSEWAWVVDSSRFVYGCTLGGTSDGV